MYISHITGEMPTHDCYPVNFGDIPKEILWILLETAQIPVKSLSDPIKSPYKVVRAPPQLVYISKK
jgi:hypothetical protein